MAWISSVEVYWGVVVFVVIIGFCSMPLVVVLVMAMLLILRHMWFRLFSVKFSRFCPSLVSS